jgi:hypothetical protein
MINKQLFNEGRERPPIVGRSLFSGGFNRRLDAHQQLSLVSKAIPDVYHSD